MKIKLISNRAGAAVAALVASIGITTSAKATPFQDLPATPPGDQYVFKIAAFTNFTLYQNISPGQAVGFGQGGAAGSLGAGVAALDAPAVIAQQAVGAHAIGFFDDKKEDTWGIATITQIFRASNPFTPVWQSGSGPGTDNQQLTVMYYGKQDYYVTSTAVGTQTTDGVGLYADIYLQDTSNGSFTSFNQHAPGGAACRHRSFCLFAGY